KAESLSYAFAELSTPLVADAALRLKIPLRISPPGIRAVTPNQRLAGPALAVRHFGSVDVFLEAMQGAQPGEVLVIDNGGRLVESGDLVFADDDGCLFVTAERVDELLSVARKIWQRERHQTEAIKSGHSLREQLEFARYLEKRATDSSYTFREHLRKISGAIEE